MTSVAFASRLQAGDSDDGCSDLNQVVARIEQSIASIAGAGVGLQFALSPNAVRVAVDAIALEQIVLGLCAEAASLLSPGGRLVIETRGLNDAHLASPWAAIPAGGVRPRVIVRAEQLGHSPPPSALRTARSEVELGRADLEALLERHGAALAAGERAVFLLRSAIADLHVAERVQATARLAVVITRGGGFSPDVGIRDVAESWAGMRAEPRLLANMDRPRRDRVLARATEALALAVGTKPPGADEAHVAREILGALAFVEERWEDALGLLAALADEPSTKPAVAAGFLIAAGDIRATKLGDRAAAQVLYDRATALAPKDSRLTTRVPGAIVATLAHDVTDEMIL